MHKKNPAFAILASALILVGFLCPLVYADIQPAPGSSLPGNAIDKTALLEESGRADNEALRSFGPREKMIPMQPVLLIPDSRDDIINIFDPFDGTFLGTFIADFEPFTTPKQAVPGPDGNVWVSDQVADAIFVFDQDGNYLYTFADGTDGLNNIRGIDFYQGHTFVTSGDDYVAEFDGPHSRLPDFINDGSDPFDIFFFANGTSLLADIAGSNDNIRYYKADGTLDYELFKVNFPEQIVPDPLSPGDYLHIAFSGDVINDFDIAGTIYESTFFNNGRGIYRLGNGNLLATAGDGVWEIEPGTGAVIEQKYNQSSQYIEYWEPNFLYDQSYMTPAPLWLYWMYAVEPINVTVYVGHFDEPYTASDVNLASILLDGSVAPVSATVIPSLFGFEGEVLCLEFPAADFLANYGNLTGENSVLYQVTGEFADLTPWTAEANVTIFGKDPYGGLLRPEGETPGVVLPNNTLLQNYPNPFNINTDIPFVTESAGHVTVKVYNVAGQLVKTLFDGVSSPGLNLVSWDGTNSQGEVVASGVYFYRIMADDFVQTRKMTLLK